MIRVEHLNKSFDGKTILSDINFSFDPGKVNLIIGKSGSGKTVLLKSLIGIHDIDSGHIYFDGTDLTTANDKTLRELRSQIGVVFQGGALFDSQTVLENVMFPLGLFTQMSYEEKVERAKFCLKRVNLDGADSKYPAEISGGMKKRVAIARAIVMQPKFLFCDEPNSGLDPRTSLVIDQLIQDITREYNICTIVNSHDMNSIMEIGDNIVFLRNGVKEWQGSRHEIFEADNEALNDFVFASELFKKVKSATRSV